MTNDSKQFYQDKMTLIYFLLLIFFLIMLDISYDVFNHAKFSEILFDIFIEGSILIVVLYMVYFIWRKFEKAIVAKNDLSEDLVKTKEVADLWQRKSNEYVKEFQNHILFKFNEWQLSKSEKEVALLLLQGKCSKEIAKLRFTAERTIRNQCQSIYVKTNLAGKNELLAYFLNEMIKDLTS